MLLALVEASSATAMFSVCAIATARRRAILLGSISTWLPCCLAADALLAMHANVSSGAVVAVAGAIVAAIVDARTGLIFDPLVGVILLGTFSAAGIDGTPLAAVEGCAGSACALGAIWLATRGAGIGLGDVKLGAAMGAGLGIDRALAALALAFVFGAAYGLLLIALRRASRTTALPFAPFIAGGAFVAVSFPQMELR